MKKKLLYISLLIIILYFITYIHSETKREYYNLSSIFLNQRTSYFQNIKLRKIQISNIPDNNFIKSINLKDNNQNQIKRIPILMYHEIKIPEESSYGERYTVSPSMFKKQLKIMYKNNYIPISIEEFLNDNLNSVPSGKKPFIITFDNATSGQFHFIKQNNNLKIDPNCAIGILNKFENKYPDFKAKATFFIDFINSKGLFQLPFQQDQYWPKKLSFLKKSKYNIYCHTCFHNFISKVKRKTVLNNIRLYNYLIKTNNQYKILAYPYGDIPDNDKKINVIKKYFDFAFGAFSNKYGHKSYRIHSKKFIKYNIPRIEINNNLKNIKKYILK